MRNPKEATCLAECKWHWGALIFHVDARVTVTLKAESLRRASCCTGVIWKQCRAGTHRPAAARERSDHIQSHVYSRRPPRESCVLTTTTRESWTMPGLLLIGRAGRTDYAVPVRRCFCGDETATQLWMGCGRSHRCPWPRNIISL